jgi:hypothetical protein
MATIRGAEVASIDISSDDAITLSSDRGYWQTRYTSCTALHRLILYSTPTAQTIEKDSTIRNPLQLSDKDATNIAATLIDKGCSITHEAQWTRGRHRDILAGKRFPQTLSFVTLVQELIDPTPKPWKEILKHEGAYPHAITEKSMLLAICKGIRSAITPKEAATLVDQYLFAGPKSIVMGYVGHTTNSPEEEIEVAKLDTLIAHHQ